MSIFYSTKKTVLLQDATNPLSLLREKLVSKKQIQGWIPSMDNLLGGVFIDWCMALFGLNKVNSIYDRCKEHEGVEFCEQVLRDIGVTVKAENADVIERFDGQPFVTVANHPYGHVDALCIISVVGKMRPDYKVTANFILSLIDTMSDHFIRVNPYEKNNVVSGAASVRHCLEHIENGKPLGCFPAGAVSLPQLTWKGYKVVDRPWKMSTVRMIRKAEVPVIPIWVSGKNSWVYNFLGLFGWQLRTIRLPHELFNKRNRIVTVRFGQPIMPEELASIESRKVLAEFLKLRVYSLADKR